MHVPQPFTSLNGSRLRCLPTGPFHWKTVGIRTVLPRLSRKNDYVATAFAIFGTTASLCLFCRQASQEVEEMSN